MFKKLLGFSLVATVLIAFAAGVGFDWLSAHGMEQPGYVALAILISAAILWITEAVPLFVTSLTILLLALVWLMPTMKAGSIKVDREMFLAPFFSDVIVLFLGGFAISSALHKRRLDEFLAILMLRASGGTLPGLLFGIMIVTAFLSMWLSNTATAAMMLAMVLPIANQLEDSDQRGKGLLLAVAFAANAGGLGTPIGSPPNAITMQYMSEIGIEPTFAQWMLIGVPGVAVMLVLAWIVLIAIYGHGSGKLPISVNQVRIKMDAELCVILGTVGITVIGWTTTSLHGLSSGTIALIPVVIFFGSGVLAVGDLRDMSWEVLLMMGGGLCLGSVISESGLADWLIALLPVSGFTTFTLTIIFGSVACFMSALMSNTATANLLLPIIVGMSAGSATPMMIGTAFGCSLAMPFPVSTPPNAMAFSSGKLSVLDLAIPGTLLTLSGIALAFTTGYWWWKTVGLW
ncbi:MAG: SLC13 family permease [Planctomycetota bacterium]